MAGTENITAAAWVIGRLQGDATLNGLVDGIWDTEAPAEATYPLVIVGEARSFVDSEAMPGRRVLTTGDLLVKVVAEGRLWPTAAVARIDALLAGQRGTTPGGFIYGCRRISTVKYPEHDSGRDWRHLGAIWRVTVRES